MSKYFTIDGFEQLTRQQMFDMALLHIRKTQKKSTTDSNICVYGGTGCAASVFLRPECKEIADTGKTSGSWHYLHQSGTVPSHELNFVISLQLAHDCTQNDEYFMASYERKMMQIAASNMLKYTPPAGGIPKSKSLVCQQ